ncbi:MAG: radical SAM family heme chaperone HemW [Chitinophagales bacterium]
MHTTNDGVAGIYIHIPFCKKACHYCNFHFSTSLHYVDRMQQALLHELALQKEYIGARSVRSIYFGGGTPSVLSAEQISSILEQIRLNYTVVSDAEITLEANPDDLDKEKLQSLFSAGINRLSIGVQSFNDDILQWMNRSHSARQAERCIADALDTGFKNITADLIYGVPQLDVATWQENIEKMVGLGVAHLSCYALTVEEKTALFHQIARHQTPAPDDLLTEAHYMRLTETMHTFGFEHYEISNFAKPGYRAVHNSAYWEGSVYLGIGPSAHSYNGVSRQWNIAHNQKYMESIEGDALPFIQETLTPTMQLNEYIMTGLRTARGISLQEIADRFGTAQSDTLLLHATKYVRSGMLVQDAIELRIPEQHFLISDALISSLFFEE